MTNITPLLFRHINLEENPLAVGDWDRNIPTLITSLIRLLLTLIYSGNAIKLADYLNAVH